MMTEKQVKYSADLKAKAIAELQRLRDFATTDAARDRLDKAIAYLQSLDPAKTRFFLDHIPTCLRSPFPYSARDILALVEDRVRMIALAEDLKAGRVRVSDLSIRDVSELLELHDRGVIKVDRKGLYDRLVELAPKTKTRLL